MNAPYDETPGPDEVRRTVIHPVVPVRDTIWNRRGLWASITLGAVIGFAATVVMATFGTATGIVAGAVAADKADERDTSSRDRYESDRSYRENSDRTVTAPAAATGVEPSSNRNVEPAPNRIDEKRRPDSQSNTHPSATAPAPTERNSRDNGRTVDPAPAPAPTPVQDPAPSRVEENESRTETAVATTKDERDAMKGAAVGGALWLILTAVVAGLAGGYVAGRFAQVYTNESTIVGLGSWAVGVLIMVGLAAFGASGLMGGIGAGAGELANSNANVNVDAETGKAAAASLGIATWGFLVALLVGLASSILGAHKAVNRRLRYVERDRPTYGTTTTPVSPAMP